MSSENLSRASDAMTRPIAHLSVDLDPIDTHLAGYGIRAPHCDRIYRTAVPRLLDLLDGLHLRATLFVVARDAEREAPLWREAVARGHEIGSHSMSHPIPFATLPPAERLREVGESRRRLEDAVGRPVLGFRAPGWDVDQTTLDAVAGAGYRYDASILPSPALLPGALLRLVLSRGRMRPHALGRSIRLAWSRRLPYRVARDGGLREFPLAVSPVLRVPFTHTLWYVAPRAVCWRTYRAIRRSGGPLSYMLHAADLIDLKRDEIDARMARHPGMQLGLDAKLALLKGFLGVLSAEYRIVTYEDAVGSTSGERTPGAPDAQLLAN